jgi:hypothetical protein
MIAYRLLNAQTQPEFQEVQEPDAGPGQVLDFLSRSATSIRSKRRRLRMRALRHTAIKPALPGIWPGSTAVVIGVGGLGLYAIQFLRQLTSARIIAVDSSEARLSWPASMAPTMLSAATEEN